MRNNIIKIIIFNYIDIIYRINNLFFVDCSNLQKTDVYVHRNYMQQFLIYFETKEKSALYTKKGTQKNNMQLSLLFIYNNVFILSINNSSKSEGEESCA